MNKNRGSISLEYILFFSAVVIASVSTLPSLSAGLERYLTGFHEYSVSSTIPINNHQITED